MDHLLAMDDLRDTIRWRGYAQLDPLVEYQREASALFEDLMFRLQKEVLDHFFLTQPAIQVAAPEQRIRSMEARKASLEEAAGGPTGVSPEESEEALEERRRGDGRRPQTSKQTPYRAGPKVGRNDPCPCGSGKKYKKCCGVPTGQDESPLAG
jgi:preprotein translocase subunit SecA